MNKVRRIVTS